MAAATNCGRFTVPSNDYTTSGFGRRARTACPSHSSLPGRPCELGGRLLELTGVSGPAVKRAAPAQPAAWERRQEAPRTGTRSDERSLPNWLTAPPVWALTGGRRGVHLLLGHRSPLRRWLAGEDPYLWQEVALAPL